MGLHHKLCHTLGGLFDLPHAETHAIVLPYALAYNAPMVPEVMARLCRAMGSDDPVGVLLQLEHDCSIPLALCDIGMPYEGIALAVEQALRNPYDNPRPVEAGALAALITRAWSGIGI
jgi:maleylacetate reductase